MSRAMKATMTAIPPKCIIAQTMAQVAKATPAVTNHPPITDITPVTRNTALSRLHARSAKELPIATMNVT